MEGRYPEAFLRVVSVLPISEGGERFIPADDTPKRPAEYDGEEKEYQMTIITHFTTLSQSQDNVLGVRIQGRLDESVFRDLAAELEGRSAAHGRLRVLLELKSIKNYAPHELWDEMKLASPGMQQVERLAIVCEDDDYRHWMAALSKATIEGEVQYFNPEQLRAAWEWVKE